MSHVSDPGYFALAVTPSDSTVFDAPTRSLRVGTAGLARVRMHKQQNEVVVYLTQGDNALVVDKVMATDTAAAAIVRVW